MLFFDPVLRGLFGGELRRRTGDPGRRRRHRAADRAARGARRRDDLGRLSGSLANGVAGLAGPRWAYRRPLGCSRVDRDERPFFAVDLGAATTSAALIGRVAGRWRLSAPLACPADVPTQLLGVLVERFVDGRPRARRAHRRRARRRRTWPRLEARSSTPDPRHGRRVGAGARPARRPPSGAGWRVRRRQRGAARSARADRARCSTPTSTASSSGPASRRAPTNGRARRPAALVAAAAARRPELTVVLAGGMARAGAPLRGRGRAARARSSLAPAATAGSAPGAALRELLDRGSARRRTTARPRSSAGSSARRRARPAGRGGRDRLDGAVRVQPRPARGDDVAYVHWSVAGRCRRSSRASRTSRASTACWAGRPSPFDRHRMRDRLRELRLAPWGDAAGDGAPPPARRRPGRARHASSPPPRSSRRSRRRTSSWSPAAPGRSRRVRRSPSPLADVMRRPGAAQLAFDHARLLGPLGTIEDAGGAPDARRRTSPTTCSCRSGRVVMPPGHARRPGAAAGWSSTARRLDGARPRPGRPRARRPAAGRDAPSSSSSSATPFGSARAAGTSRSRSPAGSAGCWSTCATSRSACPIGPSAGASCSPPGRPRSGRGWRHDTAPRTRRRSAATAEPRRRPSSPGSSSSRRARSSSAASTRGLPLRPGDAARVCPRRDGRPGHRAGRAAARRAPGRGSRRAAPAGRASAGPASRRRSRRGAGRRPGGRAPVRVERALADRGRRPPRPARVARGRDRPRGPARDRDPHPRRRARRSAGVADARRSPPAAGSSSRPTADGELLPATLDVGSAGAILVVGARIDAEALTRARAMGVRGIVVATLPGKDRRDFLASEARQRAALHRLAAVRRARPPRLEPARDRRAAVMRCSRRSPAARWRSSADPPALVFDPDDGRSTPPTGSTRSTSGAARSPVAQGRWAGSAGVRAVRRAGRTSRRASSGSATTPPVALPLADLERFV